MPHTTVFAKSNNYKSKKLTTHITLSILSSGLGLIALQCGNLKVIKKETCIMKKGDLYEEYESIPDNNALKEKSEKLPNCIIINLCTKLIGIETNFKKIHYSTTNNNYFP